MVARGDEGGGDVIEKIVAVVRHGGGFAVHHPVVDDDFAAESLPDTLVPEANAHDRQLAAEVFNDVDG